MELFNQAGAFLTDVFLNALLTEVSYRPPRGMWFGGEYVDFT